MITYISYNPLERREACKGAKEANKRVAPAQVPSKPSSAALKAQPSQSSRKNDGNTVNAPHVTTKPASTVPVQDTDEQITEMKLCVEILKKERDFYFAKLRDIEIMCQNPELEHLPIVSAIHRILYSTNDNPSVLAEAEDMLLPQQKQELSHDPTASETSEKEHKQEAHKRKDISTLEVDVAVSLLASPKPKLLDPSDVHHSGSLLTNN